MKTLKISLIIFLSIGFITTATSTQYFQNMAGLMKGLSNDSTYLSGKINAFLNGNLSRYTFLQACRNKLERAKIRTRRVTNAQPPTFFSSTHTKVVLVHVGFQLGLDFFYNGIRNNDMEKANAGALVFYYALDRMNEVNATIQQYLK